METINLVLIIAAAIVSIGMIVAILRIPKIVKYQRSMLKLTALMAKKSGISGELIEKSLHEADAWILVENGNNFEKELSNIK
jgi:hypothetical protein